MSIKKDVLREYSDAENVTDGLTQIMSNMRSQTKRKKLTDIATEMLHVLSQLNYKQTLFKSVGARLEFSDTYGSTLAIIFDKHALDKYSEQYHLDQMYIDKIYDNLIDELSSKKCQKLAEKAHYNIRYTRRKPKELELVDNYTHRRINNQNEFDQTLLHNVPKFDKFIKDLNNLYIHTKNEQHKKDLEHLS